MALRRIFHVHVVESDTFLDMPPGAQSLYFHLGMHADDDGFVNGPKQICRMIGTQQKYIQVLEKCGFLLCFGEIVVLRHWLVANTLNKRRLHPLQYPEIAKQVYVLDNKTYSKIPEENSKNLLNFRKNFDDFTYPENFDKKSDCAAAEIGDGKKKVYVQKKYKVRQNKITEDKGSQDKAIQENLKEDKAAVAAVPAEPGATAAADSALCIMNGELGKGVVLLTQDQIADLLDRMGIDSFDYYVDKLASFILHSRARVKNHYATIVKWWSQDKECMQ